MLTAAFDASGHESDQRFLVVAGFVSSTEDWGDLSQRWTKRIQRDGISCFHAVECENNTNEFWGWKDKVDEKTKLKEDLIDIIQSCTYRLFASVVEIGTLGTLSPENRAQYGLRAYALAGRTCAARVRQWSASWGARCVPELVFEEGDVGSAELETRLVEDGFSKPIFSPKRDGTKRDGQVRPAFIPLQAADFFAYELFVASKTLSADRWELEALIRKPGTMGTYQVGDLKELDRLLALRTEELKNQERITRQ